MGPGSCVKKGTESDGIRLVIGTMSISKLLVFLLTHLYFNPRCLDPLHHVHNNLTKNTSIKIIKRMTELTFVFHRGFALLM